MCLLVPNDRFPQTLDREKAKNTSEKEDVDDHTNSASRDEETKKRR